MKKILVVLTAVLLVVSLVGCNSDKSESIKKSFEEAGWTVSTVKADSENVLLDALLDSLLDEEQREDLSNYELIFCKNGLKTALVIKFPSASDLKDFLVTEDEDGKKDTSAYDDAKEDGRINGNCLLLSTSNDAKNLFK